MQADWKRLLSRTAPVFLALSVLLSLAGCAKTDAEAVKTGDITDKELQRAQKLIRSGDYADALLALNAALARSPKDPKIHLNLGWLYLYTGDLKRAKTELEAVNEKLPGDAETFHLRGSLFSALKQHDDAVKNLEEALRRSPKDSSIFFDLATSLAALNRNEEALGYLDHGFEYIPDKDLQTHLNFLLASCDVNSKLKHFEDAIDDCRQAAEITPNTQERQRIVDMIENMRLIQQIENPSTDAQSATPPEDPANPTGESPTQEDTPAPAQTD